jgi:hypothetical protein
MASVGNASSAPGDLVAFMNQLRTSSASSVRNSALKSAHGAMSDMTSLMAQVRILDRQAGSLSASNTAGLDALRKNVDAALTKFNDISKTYNPETKSEPNSSTSSQPATLDEMRNTITEMRSNLKENISKVGSAMQKAIASGASMSATSSTSTLWSQFAERQSDKYL